MVVVEVRKCSVKCGGGEVHWSNGTSIMKIVVAGI